MELTRRLLIVYQRLYFLYSWLFCSLFTRSSLELLIIVCRVLYFVSLVLLGLFTRSPAPTSFHLLHPAPQLCACCQAIPWPSVPIQEVRYEEKILYYDTFALLQESADKGCILCQFFWFQIMNGKDITITKPATQALLRASVVITLSRNSFPSESQTIIMRIEVMEERRWVQFKPYHPHRMGSYKGLRIQQIKYFAEPDLIQEEVKDLITEYIQPWMESCSKKQADHEHCGSLDAVRDLPKRLIDVGELQNDGSWSDRIKLIEQPTEGDYLILSYCWGKGNDCAKTTKYNIKQRLLGFATASLPRTIQDAINLTRLMGFQYLWVDAVCIVQSVENDPGEFEEEAIKMRDYYANARCCISASLASDSSEGFLKQRRNARYPIQRIDFTLSTSYVLRSQSVTFGSEPQSDQKLHEILTQSPLMQRGWYLQELLLSRRILHWTKHGLICECRSSLFIEGSLERWDNTSNGIPRDALAIRDGGKLTSAGWYQVLAFFSKSKVTFPRDRFYAIRGIASLFSEHLGTENINGVLRCSLAHGLAWHYNPEYLQEKYLEPRQSQFPTWCWASNGPVGFNQIDNDSSFICEDHSRRTLYHTSHPRNAALGQTHDSRLFLRAPLIVVKLRLHWACIERLCGNWAGHWVEKYSSYSPDNGFGTRSSNILHWAEEVTAQWLLLGKVAGEHQYGGLLVKQVTNEEQGTYRRYGYLTISSKIPERMEDYYEDLSDIVLV